MVVAEYSATGPDDTALFLCIPGDLYYFRMIKHYILLTTTTIHTVTHFEPPTFYIFQSYFLLNCHHITHGNTLWTTNVLHLSVLLFTELPPHYTCHRKYDYKQSYISDYVIFNRYAILRPITGTNKLSRISATRTNHPRHIVSKEIINTSVYLSTGTITTSLTKHETDIFAGLRLITWYRSHTWHSINTPQNHLLYFRRKGKPVKMLTHHRNETTHMVPNRNTVQYVSTMPSTTDRICRVRSVLIQHNTP